MDLFLAVLKYVENIVTNLVSVERVSSFAHRKTYVVFWQYEYFF